MEWKTELERMKEKIELLGSTCLECQDALEIKEALRTENRYQTDNRD